MTYSMREDYKQMAAQLPEYNLPLKTKGLPVVLKRDALPKQACWQTYRNVIANWPHRDKATVYQEDGVGSKLDESYRKTDTYNGRIFHEADTNLASLNDMVAALATQTWGIGKVESIHGWWLAGYDVGGKFDEHCDLAIRRPDGSYYAVEPRIITALFYVNGQDGNDWGFQGGTLEFPGIVDRYGQCFAHKPQEGDLVIFPSHWGYSHRVTEVTKGYRIAATSFFRLAK